MAKNYIQPGATITVAAPYALASGGGCLVGRIFGVASADALITAPVELVTEGVFDLPKIGSQEWTVGTAVFWDDGSTPKRATTVGGNSNVFIGAAVLPVTDAAGNLVGRVKLHGAAIRRAAFVPNAAGGDVAAALTQIDELRNALRDAGLMAHA